jgi:hypothetical protein
VNAEKRIKDPFATETKSRDTTARTEVMYNNKSERRHYSLMKNAHKKEFYTQTAFHYHTSFNL